MSKPGLDGSNHWGERERLSTVLKTSRNQHRGYERGYRQPERACSVVRPSLWREDLFLRPDLTSVRPPRAAAVKADPAQRGSPKGLALTVASTEAVCRKEGEGLAANKKAGGKRLDSR